MRILKTLGLAPLLLTVVLATGAVARDYGKSGSMTQPMQPSPQAQPVLPGTGMQRGMQGMTTEAFPDLGGDVIYDSGIIGEGEGVYYLGTLTDVDRASNQLVVRTEGPGRLGPQQADIPFRTSADTTIGVCFQSIVNCESFFASERGWDVLSNLEDISPLASGDKRVLIIGNPDTNEVVHVQVLYGGAAELVRGGREKNVGA